MGWRGFARPRARRRAGRGGRGGGGEVVPMRVCTEQKPAPAIIIIMIIILIVIIIIIIIIINAAVGPQGAADARPGPAARVEAAAAVIK